MSLINTVVIRIHVCPWDLERKLVGFSGRFCHTCHTFHTHACHTSHINHTNHTNHTSHTDIAKSWRRRRSADEGRLSPYGNCQRADSATRRVQAGTPIPSPVRCVSRWRVGEPEKSAGREN